MTCTLSAQSAAASAASSAAEPSTPSSIRPAASRSARRSSSTEGSARTWSSSATSTTWRSGTAVATARTRPTCPTKSPGSRRALAILLDMTRTHVPVLAGELIDILDPQPGEVAVDCTFGAGGHARLVAERIGPTGTLIAIDRDPVAESHFDDFAAEVPCQTRFVHASFAEGLRELVAEGVKADLVYVDLGISSMQVDTWERGFSYSYDAPLDMRMDSEQDLDAREV